MASLFFLREKGKKKRKDSEKNDKRKLMVFETKEATLKNFAKKKVEQYIQGVLVRNVLNCMQQETSEELEEVFHRVMTHIGNWINFGELRELILKNLPVIEFTNGMGIVKGLLMFPEIFPKDLPLPPASKKMSAPFPSLAEGKRGRKALGHPDSADEWTKIFLKKLNDIRSTARLHNYCRSTPPEIDKNEELYKVCYECLRRSKNNVLCPKCQLVYLCSMECNKNDIINPRSRHKCKLAFFGLREGDWFVLDPTRAASELFQTSISGESLMKTSLAASAIFEKEEDPTKKSIRKSIKKIDKGIKKSKLKRDVSKVSIVSQGSKTKAKKIGKKKSSVLKSAQKNKTKKPKKRKSISKKKKGRKSKIYKNVKPFSIKGKRQRKRGYSYDLGRRTSGIMDSNICDVIDLLEKKLSQRETKLEEMTKLSTNYQTSETLDIDYNILGGKAKEEEYWDKMEETKYLLEDRLNYFLNLLFNKYGETFDIDNYLPFLIYRNGYLYYKYYKQGEKELVLENYSFN